MMPKKEERQLSPKAEMHHLRVGKVGSAISPSASSHEIAVNVIAEYSAIHVSLCNRR